MNFDTYKNTLPYPTEAEFRTTYWYKGGKLVAERHGDHVTTVHVSGLRMDECANEIVVDRDALRAARRAYGAETARLTELFKQDLFKDLGIENHPLREKLYSKAWEDGHSAGFSEVYNCASNLVDLIQMPPEVTAAIKVLNKIEYTSDGSIRRYPEENEYNAAIGVLKSL